MQARSRNLLAVLFLAIACTAFTWARAEDAGRTARVPFDLFQNNILVSATLNDRATAWFIFDTGASVSVVDAAWIAQAGTKLEGSATLMAGGGNVETQFAQGVTLRLHELTAPNQLFAAMPLDRMRPLFGRDVRGILGNTFIKDYVIEIDYVARVLAFHPPGTFDLANDPQAMPVENRGGIPYIPVEIWPSPGAPIGGRFEIDTGSIGALSLNRSFAEAHQVLARVPANRKIEGAGAGLGGDMRTTLARIDRVGIGAHTFRAPVIDVSHDAAGVGASEEAGFIGGEILRRFTVVLDLRSRRVLLKPNAHFGQAFGTDLSGLELMAESEDFGVIRIKSVRSGYPAADARLRAGDVILSVDGKAAGELGLDALARLFSRPGATYQLLLRRESRDLRVRLELKPLI